MQHADCHIAVVGGGPAGATTAYLLAKAGYDVMLFDRYHFPRAKLCAGLLTWKTIQSIEQIFGMPLVHMKTMGLIKHTCRDYRIFFNKSEIARGRLTYPFHFIDRSAYDHYWLQMAKEAGVNVHTGIAVKSVEPALNRLLLYDGRRITAHIIVGADGVWSKVRGAMHPDTIQKSRWHKGLAATIEVLTCETESAKKQSVASLHFGHVPWGYGWSFPRGKEKILGIAGLKLRQGPSIRQGFENFLSAIDTDTNRLPALRGYPLPYGNHLARPARGRMLLVGDACGLADPLLGEGIYYAHQSARAAARAIIVSGSRWDRAADHHIALMNRHVLRELRWIHFLRNALFTGGMHRRYRGLKLFFRLFPKRLEAAVHGRISFAHLLVPGWSKITY